MEKYIIITNNPMTACNASVKNVLCYNENLDILGVLSAVRSKVHEGYKLATHPLTSSIKPNETPYKTVLLYNRQGQLCTQSLEMIESAILVTERFVRNKPPRLWPDIPGKILDDLATIDYDMVQPWIKN